MKKIAGIVALVSTVILTSCGGADSDTSPFVGKIDFKVKAMGMDMNGSMTMDMEAQQVTYRVDNLEALMGMDMAVMVDMKKNKTYSICPSKGIYMEMPMSKDDMKAELPSKAEVAEMKKEFFSKLKKTGKTEEINGLTCDEYTLKAGTEGVDNASIWVSKTMLDRMTGNVAMMEDMKALGMEEMMIGFPMKASFTVEGQTGSFMVTKITEGKAALGHLDLSKMKKVDQSTFMSEVMGDSAINKMMEGFSEMEQEGLTEEMTRELEKLKDIDINTEELEKMMESMK